MDNYENSSKTGYTPPIKPRLVDDGRPEESKKDVVPVIDLNWAEAATFIAFFILVGFVFWVIFK